MRRNDGVRLAEEFTCAPAPIAANLAEDNARFTKPERRNCFAHDLAKLMQAPPR